MIDVRINITGNYEIDLEMAKVADRMKRKLIQAALRPTGQQVLAEAKAKVPVDTGALQKSIRLRNYSRRGKVGVSIFSRRPYGAYQEFGTKRSAMQKHLRPALYDRRTQYVSAARRAVLSAIASANANTNLMQMTGAR